MLFRSCEQEGISPDLLTLAKGLGGGYQPIGAVLAQRHIVAALSAGSGLFQHGHTYLGHAVACAAALAVQQVIEREHLLHAVRLRGQQLQQELQATFALHPHVGDIRGRGLFWGLELVRERRTKQWFDPTLRLHARIKQAAMAQGLMVYPMGGTVDGQVGDHILLAPPYIVNEAEVTQIVQRLRAALDTALLEIC